MYLLLTRNLSKDRKPGLSPLPNSHAFFIIARLFPSVNWSFVIFCTNFSALSCQVNDFAGRSGWGRLFSGSFAFGFLFFFFKVWEPEIGRREAFSILGLSFILS